MDKLLGFAIFICIIATITYLFYNFFHKEKTVTETNVQNKDNKTPLVSESSELEVKGKDSASDTDISKIIKVIADNEDAQLENYDSLLGYDEEETSSNNQDEIDFDFIPFDDIEDNATSHLESFFDSSVFSDNDFSEDHDDVIKQIDSLAVASKAGKKKGSVAVEEDKNNGLSDDVIKALETLIKAGKVSTTFLQNKLGWGYPKTARIMNELEDRGYVLGRKVTITLQQLYELPSSHEKDSSKNTTTYNKNYYQVNRIELSENIKDFQNIFVESSNLKQFKENVDCLVRQVSPDNCKFVIANVGYIKNFSKTDYSYFLEVPVIENSRKVLGALGWAVKEMEIRYNILSENNCYNISEYNDKSHNSSFLNNIHYMFFIIDEIFNNGIYKEKEFLSSI
ncbi:MAG: hypothetical protein IKH13_04585, partial [Clostridia bacterium]|nr:hypothetical protein [Clostridia bacterium]